jgi:hypothetical protein
MRKILTTLSIAAVMMTACNSKKENTKTKNSDEAFNQYKERFVLQLWKQYPEWATSQGFHNYDSVLTVPTEEARKTEVAFVNANLDSLKSYDIKSLNAVNRTDFYLIENQLKQTLFYINDL